ncbi:hypothetical protein [Brachybacterium sp. sponge]|uniref:hypothetical protein n=1 Tax=Brachybacterium sp. sponge TaxID=1775432 RepID=UPI0007A375D6|nr:hypothetical protein [Brachybacterium sp. sponge]
MITPDASSRVIASGPGPEIDALVEALAAGRPAAGTEALDPSFVQSIGEIVAAASGTVEVTLSGPLSYSTHRFTLSRGGTLRRSQGQSDTVEIAAFPTSALPGALLRLTSIAPVEPLGTDTVLELPEGCLTSLFTPESELRESAWGAVIRASHTLPDAERAEFERVEPRAAQLVRRRPEGDRTSRVLLLRGRYLITAEDSTDAVRGTDPTGATRSLLTGLLRPQA